MIYPNIRTEMERGGFTVHQLAAILGLPLSALVYKLHGKCEFTLYEIECLANLFDCSLDYLVGHRVVTRAYSPGEGMDSIMRG